ncbi:MAG: hypothetical protein ABIS29_06280 [Vicinamibacterales bacterium]
MMSHPLLMALFGDVSSAAAAARGAHALGVDRSDLSVVASDHESEGRIATQIEASPGSEIEDSTAASRLGELSGYILAAIAIGLPGTGAVVAAGPLAAELGEAAGHVAGQVAGDLKSTLMKAGMSETAADEWRAQIEQGRAILLGIHARSARADDIKMLLEKSSLGPVVQTEWDD